MKEIYDFKIITPPTVEKLVKAKKITKDAWDTLQVMISQSEGKPSVAPVSDKRPAISLNAADDFDAV